MSKKSDSHTRAPLELYTGWFPSDKIRFKNCLKVSHYRMGKNPTNLTDISGDPIRETEMCKNDVQRASRVENVGLCAVSKIQTCLIVL